MKTSRILRGLPLALLSVTLLACVASAQSIIQQWSFNDAASSELTAAANAVPGGSSWGANITASTTDGFGSFVVGNNNFGSGGQSSFALLDGESGGISTGQLVVDVAVSAWSFGTRSPQFQINTLNAGGDVVAGILFDVGSLSAFVGGLSDTGFDLPSDDDLILAKTLSGPYVFRLEIDYATNVYRVSASNNGGAFDLIGANSIYDITAPDLDRAAYELEFYARFNATGASMNVDSITVTYTAPIPEPSAFAVLAGLAVLGFVATRRRRR